MLDTLDFAWSAGEWVVGWIHQEESSKSMGYDEWMAAGEGKKKRRLIK